MRIRLELKWQLAVGGGGRRPRWLCCLCFCALDLLAVRVNWLCVCTLSLAYCTVWHMALIIR